MPAVCATGTRTPDRRADDPPLYSPGLSFQAHPAARNVADIEPSGRRAHHGAGSAGARSSVARTSTQGPGPWVCETPLVPEPDQAPGQGGPEAKTHGDPGAVDRGMLALLARRDAELAGGAVLVGWKIGFNTPAIQAHFGLDDPVVGYLTDTGVTSDCSSVTLAGWTAPAVEVELALRVGEDGGVAGIAPALELVDLDMPMADIEPVLAGNVCQRGVVFGDEVPGVDPWKVAVAVTKGGALVANGRPVEDPEETIAFVRRFLADHGAMLEPGQRIIAGSMVAPIAVAPGDELNVEFGPLGGLSVRFT
jgi:2-keto-4-pentenoate hydratase